MITPIDVAEWLNGKRDYAAGVELLRKYGASNFILNLLKDGPGQFNTVKLVVEVGKIKVHPAGAGAENFQPQQERPKESANALSFSVPKPEYKPDHNLEKSLRIKKAIKDLFKEIAHLHGKLAELPEGDELFECAKQVISKDLRKLDLFDQLHYFETTGKWFDELPENVVHDFNPKNPAELEQKIKNLMASRAKATKELKRPLPVAMKEHHQKRIAEFNRLIDHFKSLRA